ncbi:HNH endonuclease [Gordonia sp. CPCC 205515]|uniref:HNH endonuclease n=1 Tax=Gordonia sp. CPCC 205515 TaxID=3140791 RepID=UPI003AF408A0
MPAADTESQAAQRLTVLEEIKSAATAAQAREAGRLDDLRNADEVARKVPKARQGRGLSAEIGLARKASPQKGAQYLGFARAMTEMPHTMSALETGVLTEWRATILVRETGYLTREARGEIDRRMCADPGSLIGKSDKQIEAEAKKHAYELDPHAVVGRAAKAEKHRRVTSRPAPDLMANVTALLPMKQGVAVYAALKQHADSVVGGDERTRDQIMADTLVERITGQAAAQAVPVAVDLVVSTDALLGLSDEVAEIPGHGPIPAAMARQMIVDGLDFAETETTLRRLFTRPDDGALVSMESRARAFPKALAHLVRVRDKWCRTAYCGNAIAEIDHARAHAEGGATSADNADGCCRVHNRAKEMPGWSYYVVESGGRHTMEVTTPTGGSHTTTAPAAIGHRPATISRAEIRFHQWLAVA